MNEFKAGDRVTAVIYDTTNRPITAARNFGKVYEVKEQGGRLGVDWNEGLSAEVYGVFVPFSEFAPAVVFSAVE